MPSHKFMCCAAKVISTEKWNKPIEFIFHFKRVIYVAIINICKESQVFYQLHVARVSCTCSYAKYMHLYFTSLIYDYIRECTQMYVPEHA